MDALEFVVRKQVEYVITDVCDNYEYDCDVPVKTELYMNHNGKILEPNLKISNNLDSELEDISTPHSLCEENIVTAIEVEDDNFFIEAIHPNAPKVIIKDPEILACRRCATEFATVDELINHIEVCQRVQFPCNLCSEVYTQKAHLNNHLVCHAVERPNSCRTCGNLFIHNHELQTHMLVHEQKPVIVQPPRIIPQQTPFKKKRGRPFKNPHNEWLAMNGFRKPVSVSPRRSNSPKKPGSKPYVCEKCSKKFAREKAYLNHLALHMSVLNNKSLTCPQCIQKFETHVAFEEHVRECQVVKSTIVNRAKRKIIFPDPNKIANRILKHKCLECHRNFYSKGEYLRHLCKAKKRAFCCKFCPRSFDLEEELELHFVQTHKRGPKPSKALLKRKFKSKAIVAAPVAVSKPSQEDVTEKPNTNDRRKFSPRVCKRPPPAAYSTRKSLKEEELYENSLFQKEKENENLSEEEDDEEEGDEEEIEVVSKQNSSEGLQSNTCPLCLKTFNQRVVLTEHIRWLHIANMAPLKNGFKCTICNAMTKDKGELNVHILNHCQDAPIKNSDKRPLRRKIIRKPSSVRVSVRKSNHLARARSARVHNRIHNNRMQNNRIQRSKITKILTRTGRKVNGTKLEEISEGMLTRKRNKKGDEIEISNSKRRLSLRNNKVKGSPGKTKQNEISEQTDCDLCGRIFDNRDDLREHISVHI